MAGCSTGSSRRSLATGSDPVAVDPSALPTPALDFLAERHLATLTTLRPDGSPHVVPVGFTWDPGARVARVIASRSTRKVRNAALGCPAVLCQLDGRRWLALEGTASVDDDADAVEDAVRRYAQRYRQPRPNAERVVLVVDVVRVLGGSSVLVP